VPAEITQLTSLRHLDLSDNALTGLPAEIGKLTSLRHLDLSNNALTGLPAEIGKLASLQQLNLDVNALTRLPAEIGQLTSLQHLTLDGNGLAALPAEITQLTGLQTLWLDRNGLAVLPAEIGQLTSLRRLDLNGNELTVLPAEIGKLTGLRQLNLNNNELTRLPAQIGQLTSLQQLGLSGNNELTVLAAEIGQLTSLQQLDFSDSALTVLPAQIAQLTSLQQLNLSNNELTVLPAQIGQLTSLQQLNLSGNKLTRLPAQIGQLTSLQQLNLNNNKLTVLPAQIGQLTSLQHLDLNNNELTGLPARIGQLTSLRQLTLDGNGLTALPAEITQLTGLQTLWLDRNGLGVLPAEIGQLTSLRRLDLNGNELTVLPTEIGQLTSLQQLDLNGNELTVLPAEIGQLTSLQQLDLDDNALAALPAEIGQLTSLQRLNLNNNELTVLPAQIGQLTSLEQLDLNGNELTVLPAQIGQLTSLQQLNLDVNALTRLPAEIGQLTSLRQLTVDGNGLTALPAEITQLTGLQTLWLDRNGLAVLPAEVTQLTSLRRLDLNGNELTVLPAEIGQLTSLQRLDLNGNELTVLPAEIGQLTSLQHLDLSGNELTVLPAEISKLTSLQQLILDDNALTALPAEIGQLTSLERLALTRNDLTALPIAVAGLIEDGLLVTLEENPLPEFLFDLHQQGGAALAAYLRSLDDMPQFEAKVLLIGEGEVGKTSLIGALRDEQFVEGRLTTHGIEIRSLVLPHPDTNIDLRIRAWDFGGQEVYRITHQFFMTRHALYLVVWKPRAGQEQNEVESWLRRIRLRVAEEARALIVATHCSGERHADLDYPHLRNLFPVLLAGEFEVDNETGYHIPELRRAIADQVASLPQMGQLLSRLWIAARDEILAHEGPQISFEDFSGICQQHGMDLGQIRALAELLHVQGRVVYYGDDQGLRDFVVLDPEWLTKAISYVLEDRPTIDAGGKLNHSRLAEIWQNPSREITYPSRYHPYLLRLMEKFDISYRLDDDGHQSSSRSLIAQLVPRPRPDLPWDSHTPVPTGLRRLALFCELTEPAPGLMEWLIVRNQHSTTDIYWRNGAFFRFPIDEYKSEALLELRTPRELALEVRAPAPDYFFNTLRASIEVLIKKRWRGLEYVLTIPCPGNKSDGTRCGKRLVLSDLAVHREEGESLLCTGCRTRHDAETLLTGFAPSTATRLDEMRELQTLTASLESRLESGIGELKTEIAIHAATTADRIRSLTRTVTAFYKDCPRLFTVSPVDRRGASRVNVIKQRYRLVLWCEHPGHWHPWPNATYEADQTREVVAKITPAVLVVFNLLRAAVPVAAAGAGLVLTAAQLGHAQNELQLATALAAALPPQAPEDKSLPGTTGLDAPTLADGAVWSDLRTMILNLDKQRTPRFGGMAARFDPADDSLYWVCPEHVAYYDPGLQQLSS
jgi:internalin A